MRRTVVVVLVALVTLMVAAWPASGQPEQSRAGQEAQVDFNGDGFDDLAVGALQRGDRRAGRRRRRQRALRVGERAGGQRRGVLPGQRRRRRRRRARTTPSAPPSPRATSTATSSSTWPWARRARRIGSGRAAGAVNVLYGSAGGLTGGPLFFQANPEPNDRFGESLAAGDFNGDGFFDLAVGVARREYRHHRRRRRGHRALRVGRPASPRPGAQTFCQGSGGPASAEARDQFGFSLAPGLLAGDDVADLVVGVPGEDVGACRTPARSTSSPASAGGLVNGSLATQGNPEGGDAFGLAVATGDFDDTAGDDVAAGAPGETVNGRPVGRRGQRVQRPAERARLRAAAVPGVRRHPGHGRELGDGSGPRWRRPTATASASGTWPSASPGEDVGPDVDAGVVNLLAGSVTGPSGGSLVQQANPEDFDSFGQAIAGGFFLHDFDNNGFFDLAVGAPAGEGRHRGSRPGRSRCSTPRAAASSAPARPGRQGSAGLGGTAEAFDFFGIALE